MLQWFRTAGRWYGGAARGLTYLQDALLLVIRLYWGWQLVVAGWGKLTNVAAAAQFFQSLGIPLPTASAVVSGGGEFVGGLLLIVGLATRVGALVILVNMIVAFLTAHTGEAQALFAEPSRFITAPPFTFLLASLLILFFGPGLVSLDALIRKYTLRRIAVDAPAADPNDAEKAVTRRDVVRLSAAAVGGLLVGAGLLRSAIGGKRGPEATGDSIPKPEAVQAIDAKAPPEIQPSLLLQEPHTCCGLNTCKGKAKGGRNECAGQGTCATANSHVCQAQNDCKGQGGCGEYPGQNACQGKGACAVPLKKETWAKARPRFEELMKLAGKPVGGLPPNCPKS